ncbi:MAG TPA: glucose-6-phosphate isomerase family protein [Limnochordales bacterium]|nr:glucose-6-phosphate isomerase family protein [Limnochordales bacterium]
MAQLMQPWSAHIDLADGLLWQPRRIITRHLSDMQGLYADATATEAGLAENPLIYRVDEIEVPQEVGQLLYSITVIYPGKVGDEYYMTKGHYHERGECAEVYFGLRGRGYLLMQTRDGQVAHLEMRRGTVAYVPPYWAHRTVNVGPEPFVFYAVYPAQAGHDYHSIEETGFRVRVVERDGQPVIVDNH